MTDVINGYLRAATAIPGLPGYEQPSADLAAEWFRKFSGDVWQDAFANTFARMGGGGPRVLIAAHADGLGLMVRSVEEDGFLGFVTVGGFDPRVLPGLEVTVHGREGDYFGVIGAKPPMCSAMRTARRYSPCRSCSSTSASRRNARASWCPWGTS